MVYMHIQYPLANFEKWHQGFDAHASFRREGGATISKIQDRPACIWQGVFLFCSSYTVNTHFPHPVYNNPMLEIHNLQKVQDGKTVLDIPSFEVMDGQIAGLIARAGSGSEMLVSLLTGRSQPSAGTIRLAGIEPYADHTALSQVLGVVFAEDTVYKNLGVLANLNFLARLAWSAKRER